MAAGIRPLEEAPGYERVRIEPHPDPRLGWLEARLESRSGLITSRWTYENGQVRYEITTPVETLITIDGKTELVPAGAYIR